MADSNSYDEAIQRARQLAAKLNAESGHISAVKRHLDDPMDIQNQKRSNINDKLDKVNEVAARLSSKIGVSGGMHPGIITIEHKIPDNMVGLIIGKKGEQITKIQKDTGCTVQIEQDSKGLVDRIVTLSGTHEQIESVKRFFDDILNRARGAGIAASVPYTGAMVSIEISVPGPKAGLLIGKNGETIKALQEQLGVKMILIQESNSATEFDKPLKITGEPNKVEMAKLKVIEILNARSTVGIIQGQKPSTTFAVPNEKAGLVIGKGGETIKDIIRSSGAYVEIQKAPPPNPSIKIFNISGEEQQIECAIRLICERANIPLPPTYSANQSYISTDQFAQNWAQTQQQQQQSGTMPPPSINPYTGQPDYTAAWVEYYRRQGMHKEAEAILRQAQQPTQTAQGNGSNDYTQQWQDYSQQWQQWHQQQYSNPSGQWNNAAPNAR